MRHVDEDTLTLLALGEQQPDPEQAEHLEQCEHCRAELSGLTAVVAAGRAGGPLETPPTHVWDRIAAQIDEESTQTSDVAPAGPTLSLIHI